MTAHSQAKAGRSSIGGLDTSKPPEIFSGEAAPVHETELTRGFPPFETLSARLNEFSALSQHQAVFGENRGQPARQPISEKQKPENTAAAQLEWFEGKFGELQEALSRRESDKAEILAINSRLAEIIERIDRLTAALPEKGELSAVEARISVLSSNLLSVREQSVAEVRRISRAASEIHEAARRLDRTRTQFDGAAKETLKQFGQTVTQTAAATTSLVVQQITAAMTGESPKSAIERLELELRAFNTNSKINSERAAAALDGISATLREFLDRGGAPLSRGDAKAFRRRIGVQTPISPHAGEAPRAPRHQPGADTTGTRSPSHGPAARPHWQREKIEREKMQTRQRPKASAPDAQDQATAMRANQSQVRPNIPPADGERAFPMIGLTAVAVILLLASAALLYLYMRGDSALLLPKSALETGWERSSGARSDPSNYGLGEESGARRWFFSLFASAPTSEARLPGLFNATGEGAAGEAKLATPSAPDIETLAKAARRGDREAQYRIGLRFMNDANAPGAPAAAFRWISRAAEQGQVEAQFLLATLFERGFGTGKDEEQAAAWYRKAAETGNARAMHNLGVLLARRGDEKSYREAAVWFARAGAKGITESQYNLAALYERGLGVLRDDRKAYFWYSAAAQNGDREAKRKAEHLEHLLDSARQGDSLSGGQGSWKAYLLTSGAGSGHG